MARKLKGIDSVNLAIDRVIYNRKPSWVICSDEDEMERAYNLANKRVHYRYTYKNFILTVTKSSAALIEKNRYKMYPAIYIQYRTATATELEIAESLWCIEYLKGLEEFVTKGKNL